MINAQLPYAVATEFVITKIAVSNTIQTFDDLTFGDRVAQFAYPLLERITRIGGEVVADGEHVSIIV